MMARLLLLTLFLVCLGLSRQLAIRERGTRVSPDRPEVLTSGMCRWTQMTVGYTQTVCRDVCLDVILPFSFLDSSRYSGIIQYRCTYSTYQSMLECIPSHRLADSFSLGNRHSTCEAHTFPDVF